MSRMEQTQGFHQVIDCIDKVNKVEQVKAPLYILGFKNNTLITNYTSKMIGYGQKIILLYVSHKLKMKYYKNVKCSQSLIAPPPPFRYIYICCLHFRGE